MCPRCEGFMWCSRCSVCTPRSALCHQKLGSLISAALRRRHFHELLFMTTRLSIHFPVKSRGGLWLLWVNPADSSRVLIWYCLRKRTCLPVESLQTLTFLISMCNQWKFTIVARRADLLVRSVDFRGSDGQAAKCKTAHQLFAAFVSRGWPSRLNTHPHPHPLWQ